MITAAHVLFRMPVNVNIMEQRILNTQFSGNAWILPSLPGDFHSALRGRLEITQLDQETAK